MFGAPDSGRLNMMVTGSKGKGSHAILLAALLQKRGLRVGLFTGPHLVDFMERFRVDGEPIPEPEFTRYMQAVARVAEGMAVPRGQYIGPVGLLAVVATLWFRDTATDVNIYECGRGALHDDVNQIVHQGAIVAPVFLEHVRELGPTLADVAREKAGVVTPETQFVISNAQPMVVEQILTAACCAQQADLSVLHRDFFTDQAAQIKLPLDISYISDNATVAAIAAARVLEILPTFSRAPTTSPSQVWDLTGLQLPGRLQVVRAQPLTVVDGTIHRMSARYIVDYVQSWRAAGGSGRVGLVLAIPSGKDGSGVAETLAPFAAFVVITRAHNPHLSYDKSVYEAAAARLSAVEEAPEIAAAIALADHQLGPDDLLLVLGTQSFVGDALLHFGAPTRSIWRPVLAGGMPL